MLRPRRLRLLTLALGLLLPGTLPAQEGAAPPAPSAQTGGSARPSHKTPQGAVVAFLGLADAGDLEGASLYLDLRRFPKKTRPAAGRKLARQLSAVLERAWPVDVATLSTSPEGEKEDELAANVDAIGRIRAGGKSVPLFLQRVPLGDGHVWKFSQETLAAVPQLYAELGYGPIAEALPPFFSEHRFAGFLLWQWIGLLALLAVAWGASMALTAGVLAIGAALARRTRNRLDDLLVRRSRRPLRWLVAALVVYAGSFGLALSLRARAVVDTALFLFVLVEATRLGLRLVDVGGVLLVARRHFAAPFVPLGRRALKAALVAFAAIWGLHSLGFNVTGLLAGLGIGGLAVALASQKTVEHLFGGVTLVADQPVRVGDVCRFGDKVGVVEDIGLRSTRIRTADRTVISIPNGEFSSIQIENLSRRDRTRLETAIGLRYETTADQLRHLLAELESLLRSHPMVEAESARVRLAGFGTYALEVQLSAYVLTADGDQFQNARQDLLLRIMDVLAQCGTGFALPAHTVYSAAPPAAEGRPLAAAAEARAWGIEAGSGGSAASAPALSAVAASPATEIKS